MPQSYCRFEFEEPSPTDMHSPALPLPPSSLRTNRASHSIEPPPLPNGSRACTHPKTNISLPPHSRQALKPSSLCNISSSSSNGLHACDRLPHALKPQHHLSRKQNEKLADSDNRMPANGALAANTSASSSSRNFTERLAEKVQQVPSFPRHGVAIQPPSPPLPNSKRRNWRS